MVWKLRVSCMIELSVDSRSWSVDWDILTRLVDRETMVASWRREK